MTLRPLSPIEARVLGTLMEKARTVPDSYPPVTQQPAAGLQPEDQPGTCDVCHRSAGARGAGRAARFATGARVQRQPRDPRWAHLLCGPVEVSFDIDPGAASVAGVITPGDLRVRVEQLENEVAELRQTVAQLCQELGISPRAPASESNQAVAQ